MGLSLTSVSSDHTPIHLSIDTSIKNTKGPQYWKFNSMLLRAPNFPLEMEHEIDRLKIEHQHLEPQKKWEIIKYKIRQFCIKFSKNHSKKLKEKVKAMEEVIQKYENTPMDSQTITP